MTIFHLTPSQIEALFLVFTRISAISFTAPLFSDRRIPMQIRAGISLLLAIILQPIVSPVGEITSSIPLFVLLVCKEVLVGVVIGFSANLIFQIVQMASEMQDMSAGFSFAGMVDPEMQRSGAILGQFQMIVMWLIFLTVNGHHVLIQSIADSFYIVPLGGFNYHSSLTGQLVMLVTTMMLLALRMSAPLIGSVLLADLSFGMLQRTAPQLNLISVGFPIKIALSGIVVMFCLPYIIPMQRDFVPYMERIINSFLILGR
jgi:flagellar biosynthetic protein FliR